MNKNILATTRASLYELLNTISLDEKYLCGDCLVVDSYHLKKSFDEEILDLLDLLDEKFLKNNSDIDYIMKTYHIVDFGKLDIRSSYILGIGNIIYFLKQVLIQEKNFIVFFEEYIENLQKLLVAFYLSPIENQ